MPRVRKFKVEDALAAAAARFTSHGYHATSIADIVECLGIGRGSLYDTFGSKRGLYVHALRHHIERYCATLREIAGQAPSSMEAIMGVVAGVRDHGGFIIMAAIEMAAHDDEIGQIVRHACRETEDRFSVLIERSRNSGEIAEHVDPVETGRTLLRLCFGAGVIGEPTGPPRVRALLPTPSR